MTATGTSVLSEVKRSSGFLMLLGIGLILLGILAIAAPLASGMAVNMTVGALLIISGICQVLYAFRALTWGVGILTFVFGAASVVAGGMMLRNPAEGLAALTLVLAIYFFVDGLAGIFHSFALRPVPGWGLTLISAIASIVLGVLIWREWPLSGEWAIGVLVGVKILFSGSSMLSIGMAARATAGGIQKMAADSAGPPAGSQS